jgi:hypothetical protein
MVMMDSVLWGTCMWSTMDSVLLNIVMMDSVENLCNDENNSNRCVCGCVSAWKKQRRTCMRLAPQLTLDFSALLMKQPRRNSRVMFHSEYVLLILFCFLANFCSLSLIYACPAYRFAWCSLGTARLIHRCEK